MIKLRLEMFFYYFQNAHFLIWKITCYADILDFLYYGNVPKMTLRGAEFN